MKRIAFFLLLALGFSGSKSFGQIADGITYQAVAIDDSGKEIAGHDFNGSIINNKQISVRFSILRTNQDGELLYREIHYTYPDQYGLFSLVIGHGDVSSEGIYQNLLDINWGENKLFLKVEIDILNNKDFKLMGIQQMMAVPFAFHSLTTSLATVKYSDILNKPLFSIVATSGNYNDLTNTPLYSRVATSGNYNDLTNTPLYSTVATSGNYNDLLNAPVFSKVATSGKYDDLTNTPLYSTVATSGNYNDLTNKPIFSTVATSGKYNDLTNTPLFSVVATSGNYNDLSNKPIFSIVATSGKYNDLTNIPVYSTVATSGNYNDLTNKPVFSKVATSGNFNDLINQPLYSTVATSGNYDDLINQPIYSAVATSGNYDDLLNQPIYSAVATSGNYDDLINQPVLFDGNYNSLTDTPPATREVTDEFYATEAQIVFTLTHTPSANTNSKMYINGIRISNSAYRTSGVTLTYRPVNNGSYALVEDDRIQFDYSY